MLIGLYGGTFDPVHVGHVHAAQRVREQLGLATVQMILAARPGHRGATGASEAHRWAMLELACAQSPGLVANDSELSRGGESYTVLTLEDLHAAMPGAVPCWILGHDAFVTLPEWYRWQELMDLCNLIVLQRPGNAAPAPPSLTQMCGAHEVDDLDPSRVGQIRRLAIPMLDVSATLIRRKIAAGESVSHLLADPVCAYIKHHKLYTEDVV